MKAYLREPLDPGSTIIEGRDQAPDRPRARDGAAPAAPSASRLDHRLLTVLALGSWAAIVALGRTWGLLLDAQGRRIVLFTPPVLGGYRADVDGRFVIPVVTAALLLAIGPRVAARAPWRTVLACSSAGAALWWVALALIDGTDGLTHGLEWNREYRDAIPAIGSDPGSFLSGFVEHLPGLSIQMRAHPPGLPLLLAGMDRVGLRGAAWAATLVLVVATSGVAAVLIAVRLVAGEDGARRAAPFVVLAPAAIWIATSFDALYFGIAAWSVAALIAATQSSGRRRVGLAVGSGILGVATLMLSYGLLLVACLVIFVAWREREWVPVTIAAVTTALGIAAFAPFGFWYWAGLFGTRHEYYALDVDRPYAYFVVNNVSALALVVGPATAVALVRLRDRRLWLLVGGALLAVALADLSGLSNGEVERIWLPFAIWILPACAVLASSARATRAWLALQAASVFTLSAFINTYW